MRDFAEKRKKQLEERQSGQNIQTTTNSSVSVVSTGTKDTLSFAEKRKQQLKQKKTKEEQKKIGNDNLVAGFADYMKRRKANEEETQHVYSNEPETMENGPIQSTKPRQTTASKTQVTLRNLINTSGFTDEELAESERKKNLYTPQGFESLRGASDYAELSEKGKKLKHGLSEQAYVGNETGYFLKSYNTYYLTPEERELHNYILAKEGEEGAKAYLDSMSETMNERASGKWKEAAQNIGEEMPGRATVYDSFLSTAAAPTGILYALAQNAVGNDVDVNSPYLMGSQLEGDVREGIKENKIPMVSKGTSDFLVDTGLSMAQNVARMPMGAAGLVLAGGGAATGGYLDAKDRGASEGQALAEGAAQGVAEAFFEKFSLEGVQALKAGSVRSARDLFKNMAKQAFTEGTEEMFTEIANDWSDRAIMGELSNYQSTLNGYLNQGMSESEAKVQAFLDMVKNVALAGAGGALSGGIMGGGAQALGTYLNGRNSTIEDYQEYADSVETDEAAYENHEDYETAQTMRGLALEMVEKQQEGKKLTTMEKGYFENAVNDLAAQVEDRAQIEAQEGEKYAQTDISSPTQEKANSAAYSEPQEQNFSDLAEEFGKNGQAAISEMYDESMDTVGYFKAFSRYYNAGRYNIDMSEADSHASAALLTQEQAKKAFKAGAQDRNAEIGYDPATGEMKGMQQGEAKTGGLEYAVPSATDAQKKVADVLGKRTGLKFEIVDDSGDGTAIASYSPGVVKISANAKNFNAAVSHELTHFIKDYSADMYQLYEDTAVKAITRAEGVDIESMLDRYISRYAEAGQQITRTQAMEEIVADATEKFFNDPEYIDSLVKENRTLGEKILDFIEDMIDAIKSLIQTGSKRQAAKALEQNLEMYERARTYWMQGLQEAGDRYQEGWEKTGKGEKYQLKDPDKVTEAQIEKNYDIVRNMKPVITLKGDEFTRRDIKISEQIMNFYNSLGNVVHNEVVGDILLNKRSAKDDIAHGVGRLKSITFKAVPSVLENGKILQYQKNWKGRSYDTATIGARVDVAGGDQSGEYYVVCIVKVDETNRMYLHEVHARKMDAPSPFWTGGDHKIALPGEDAHPSNNSIVDDVSGVNKQQGGRATKIEDEPFKTSSFPQSGSRSGTSSSIYSVFDKLQNVNQKTTEQQKLQLKDSLEGDQNTKGNEKEAVNFAEGIRFQLEDVDDYQAAITDLIHENDELKEANKYLKKQFELTSKEELRQSDIEKVAGDILNRYGSSYKKQSLTGNLTKLYEYIRSYDVNPEELSGVAADIGRAILKNSTQTDNTLSEQYKDARKKIKDTKIMITDQDKQDLTEIGGYNDFRKKYFGRMKLGKDGISVNSLYEELTGEYPEMFDVNIANPADRLQQIGNFLDLTQPQIKNPYHANMDEMAYLVGQELLEAYTEIRNPSPTIADRYEAKYQKAKDDYRKRIQAFKDKTVNQYEAILADKNREIGLLKDNHERDLMVQKEKYDHKMQQRRDSITKREAKKRIIKEVTTMQKWLLEPTDSKHIPQKLRGTVADFLSNIDFSSKDDYSGVITQRTQAWTDAKDAFEKIKNASGTYIDEDGNVLYVDADPDLPDRIKELTLKVRDVEKLEDLDAYSMEELKKTVIAMKKALTEINEMKSNSRYRQASLLAEEVFRDMENLKTMPEYTGPVGLGSKLVSYDMIDPQTMFGKVGPAFKTTYDALRKGLDKKTIRLKEAEEYFNHALEESGISREDIRKWTGVSAPTHTFEVSGKEIEMSIPQIMSLYELDKRGQARKHMYDRNGGIKPDDLKVGISLDNKTLKVPQKKKSYSPVRVNRELVQKITSVLTPEQKKLADALQHFMGDQISQWGNEATMEMYGYEKFTAKDYFPITTDKNYIAQQEGADQGKSTIRNLGITKNTNKFANNPLIIEDIFDVFTRQVDQMSSYNAYVLPLSDLHKLMNYKDMRGFNGSSIKEQLGRTFGKEGVKYIDKLIDDINGSVRHESNISDMLLSNMKAASVAGNLRVAIQQPTAIVRAAAEIDVKYLLAGVGTFESGRWDKITKYAPIAQWKDWGFYQMQTSRAMKDVLVGSDSAKQRFVNKTMILAEWGDKMAWNRLWSACELETADKYKDLTNGSEEFYERVGERFSELVDKTQVADSVLHRTQIMREKDGFSKMATSFMAEPLKSYNMLYRAYYDVKMKKPGAVKNLSKTIAVYAANGFLTAVFAGVIDTLRDDDREKSLKEKYKENVWGNFKDNVNLLNSYPYVKDAISIASGYSVARTDMSSIQDLYYAWKKIESYRNGKSEYTPQYIFLNTIQSMSKLTGIPIKSITRDAVAIIDTVMNVMGGEEDYNWMKQHYNMRVSSSQKKYVELLMQAEDIGNNQLAKKIQEDLMLAGMTEEEILEKKNNVVNRIIDETVDIDGVIQEYDASKSESVKNFKAEVKNYIALKSKAGWDKKKCLEQIRAMITSIYKPLYQQAKTQAERDRIIKKCKSFYYDGKSIYEDYDFSKNWKSK